MLQAGSLSLFDAEYQEYEYGLENYTPCRGECGTLLPKDQRRHHRGRCPACRVAGNQSVRALVGALKKSEAVLLSQAPYKRARASQLQHRLTFDN